MPFHDGGTTKTFMLGVGASTLMAGRSVDDECGALRAPHFVVTVVGLVGSVKSQVDESFQFHVLLPFPLGSEFRQIGQALDGQSSVLKVIASIMETL